MDAIQAVLPTMKDQGFGRILLVTSVAAKEPIPKLTISNGLRAGLVGLTNDLSKEVAPYGVTVNSILPGFTDTERLKALKIPRETLKAKIPTGELADPQELGALACFLSSPWARSITGQALTVDGGMMAGI